VSAWVLLLTPLCGMILYLTAIRHEEVYLEKKFGDSYRRYQDRVRRWI
jgi:protein-S-isoprenylcysteine O-methyltransferase Ste14